MFEEGEELEALIRAGTKQTTLTGYFAAVSNEISNPLSPAELGIDTTTHLVYPQATNLTYQDFPTFYTWNANKKNGPAGRNLESMIQSVEFVMLIRTLVSVFSFECCCARYLVQCPLNTSQCRAYYFQVHMCCTGCFG